MVGGIESLPDDLLSEILVRVPADVLYDKARFVCRRWYNMIRSPAFVKAHLKQWSTNYGLLISYNDGSLIYVSMPKQGHIDICELDCNCTSLSSCNGLVSGIRQCRRRERDTPPLVLNPITNQAFDIVPFDSGGQSPYTYCIAYAAASMVYKVVQPCFPGHSAILSVGVDNSWRRVEHLPSDATNLCVPTPLMTEGYIHWVWSSYTQKVLTMNVETEIITESNVPLPRTYLQFYFSTGRYLTLVVSHVDYVWNVWEMKPAESGEWKKLSYNIKFETQRLQQLAKCDCEHHGIYYKYIIRPVGWVKYPEILVFGVECANTFIFCNLRTQQMNSFTGLPRSSRDIYNAFPHRETLVQLS